jgi:hypothetical protein
VYFMLKTLPNKNNNKIIKEILCRNCAFMLGFLIVHLN